jgi:hypothetical protein
MSAGTGPQDWQQRVVAQLPVPCKHKGRSAINMRQVLLRSNCKGELMEARSIDACALWIEGRQWLVSHIHNYLRLRILFVCPFVCPCKQCN